MFPVGFCSGTFVAYYPYLSSVIYYLCQIKAKFAREKLQMKLSVTVDTVGCILGVVWMWDVHNKWIAYVNIVLHSGASGKIQHVGLF